MALRFGREQGGPGVGAATALEVVARQPADRADERERQFHAPVTGPPGLDLRQAPIQHGQATGSVLNEAVLLLRERPGRWLHPVFARSGFRERPPVHQEVPVGPHVIGARVRRKQRAEPVILCPVVEAGLDPHQGTAAPEFDTHFHGTRAATGRPAVALRRRRGGKLHLEARTQDRAPPALAQAGDLPLQPGRRHDLRNEGPREVVFVTDVLRVFEQVEIPVFTPGRPVQEVERAVRVQADPAQAVVQLVRRGADGVRQGGGGLGGCRFSGAPPEQEARVSQGRQIGQELDRKERVGGVLLAFGSEDPRSEVVLVHGEPLGLSLAVELHPVVDPPEPLHSLYAFDAAGHHSSGFVHQDQVRCVGGGRLKHHQSPHQLGTREGQGVGHAQDRVVVFVGPGPERGRQVLEVPSHQLFAGADHGFKPGLHRPVDLIGAATANRIVGVVLEKLSPARVDQTRGVLAAVQEVAGGRQGLHHLRQEHLRPFVRLLEVHAGGPHAREDVVEPAAQQFSLERFPIRGGVPNGLQVVPEACAAELGVRKGPAQRFENAAEIPGRREVIAPVAQKDHVAAGSQRVRLEDLLYLCHGPGRAHLPGGMRVPYFVEPEPARVAVAADLVDRQHLAAIRPRQVNSQPSRSISSPLPRV